MVKFGAQGIQNEDDIQGNSRPVPGRYHVGCKDVEFSRKVPVENDPEKFKYEKCEESDPDCSRISVTFEVLAGTTPGQVGRELVDHFHITEKALPRLQRLALSTGLLKPGEPEREVSFSDIVPKQLVIEVVANKYKNLQGQDVDSVRVDYLGLWSVSNKAVEDVPKCKESLKLMGKTSSAAATASATASEPATQSAGAASEDKWADL